MRIYEISSTQFDPLLLEFWRTRTPEQLKYYFVQNNCHGASLDLLDFLESKGIGNAEIVPCGRIANGKKSFGWLYADVPDLTYYALMKTDIDTMHQQGLDPRKKTDRVTYIRNNDLEEEFKWIPHSWVELRGAILDPSGFYIDGRSGQFDKVVNNKSNLAERYRYF